MDAIIVSAVVGIERSHRRIFEMALETVGARPFEAIHVGDSVRFDLDGATGAGVGAMHFDPFSVCQKGDHSHLSSSRPDRDRLRCAVAQRASIPRQDDFERTCRRISRWLEVRLRGGPPAGHPGDEQHSRVATAASGHREGREWATQPDSLAREHQVASVVGSG